MINVENFESAIICPISFELMIDPVCTPCGHSFERQSIEAWINDNGNDPMTREPLCAKDLIPNLALRAAIEKWRIATQDWQEKIERAASTVRAARRAAHARKCFSQSRKIYANRNQRRALPADNHALELLAADALTWPRTHWVEQNARALARGFILSLQDKGREMLDAFCSIDESGEDNSLVLSLVALQKAHAYYKIWKTQQDLPALRQSIEQCRRAVHLHPENDEAHRHWAWCLYRTYLSEKNDDDDDDDMLGAALDRVNQAIECNPLNAAAFDVKSRVLRSLREYRAARQAGHRCVEIDPFHVRGLCHLAELIAHSSPQNALQYFEQAHRADPSDEITERKLQKCKKKCARLQRRQLNKK